MKRHRHSHHQNHRITSYFTPDTSTDTNRQDKTPVQVILSTDSDNASNPDEPSPKKSSGSLSVGSPMKDHQDQDLADEADNLPDSETNTDHNADADNLQEPLPLPVDQYVPPRSFKFPKNSNKRSCSHDWFPKYSWLHYSQENDALLCFTCIEARRRGKPGTGRGNEESFATKGFKLWNRAIFKFNIHENSQFHRESADYICQVLKRESVASRLSEQLRKEQKSARLALHKIISSIRYLSRSGQALQGSDAEKGNLMDLLHERAIDCPDLANWLQRRDKWLSHDIQNEIIEIFAHEVQRKLVSDIKSSPFFGLMADGTTDRSGDEQFSTCFRYVEKKSLKSKEICLGLYNANDGTAKTLHKTLNDVMTRLTLSKENLRGHCFDGAAAMSGHLSGVQKLLTDDQPKSIFVHCSNHSLDLVIQEIAKKCELISNSISMVKDVSKAILESAKRKTIYANVVLEPCPDYDNDCLSLPAPAKRLIPLCPTRWCVRAKSMRRFVENYARVQQTLKLILADKSCKVADERRATLRGYQKKMGQFQTMLALNVALSVCEPAEHLAKALQSTSYTASGAKHAAQALWDQYNGMGGDDFDRIWEKTEKANIEQNLRLRMPIVPRPRAPPRRLGELGGRAPPARLTPRDRVRKKYISVLDWLKNELKRRFQQPGMDRLVAMEGIILKKQKKQADDDDDDSEDGIESENDNESMEASDIESALGEHASDFDIEMLTAQLKIIRTIIPQEKVNTIKDFAEELAALPDMSRKMVDQVELLVVLLLTVPATSTSCERSLSGLRRLKTYMRSKMSQKRLTHLLLLHIHRDETFAISIDYVIKEFVSRTNERRKIFGYCK